METRLGGSPGEFTECTFVRARLISRTTPRTNRIQKLLREYRFLATVDIEAKGESLRPNDLSGHCRCFRWFCIVGLRDQCQRREGPQLMSLALGWSVENQVER